MVTVFNPTFRRNAVITEGALASGRVPRAEVKCGVIKNMLVTPHAPTPVAVVVYLTLVQRAHEVHTTLVTQWLRKPNALIQRKNGHPCSPLVLIHHHAVRAKRIGTVP